MHTYAGTSTCVCVCASLHVCARVSMRRWEWCVHTCMCTAQAGWVHPTVTHSQRPGPSSTPSTGTSGDHWAPTTAVPHQPQCRALGAPRAPTSPQHDSTLAASPQGSAGMLQCHCCSRGRDRRTLLPPSCLQCPPTSPRSLLHSPAASASSLLLVVPCPLPSILASAVQSPSPWHPPSSTLPSPQPDH